MALLRNAPWWSGYGYVYGFVYDWVQPVYECVQIILVTNSSGDVYPFKLLTLQIW